MTNLGQGTVPRTDKWLEVLHLLSTGGSERDVAAATVMAAAKPFDRVCSDPVLARSLWLLVQIPRAAVTEDFASTIAKCGLDAGDNPTIADVLATIPAAVRRHTRGDENRTELGGIARLAASEALQAALRDELDDIYEAGPEDSRRALVALGDQQRLTALVTDFLARLLRRQFSYLIGGEASNRVGGQRRFGSSEDLAVFNRRLAVVCRESALTIEQEIGSWLSSHRRDTLLDYDQTAEFARFALSAITTRITKTEDAHGG